MQLYVSACHRASFRKSALATGMALALGLSGSSAALAASPSGASRTHPLAADRQVVPDPAQMQRQFSAWREEHPEMALRASVITGASTHVVTNCNDSGAGSLRDALTNANSGDYVDLSGLDCDIELASGIIFTQDDLTLYGNFTGNVATDRKITAAAGNQSGLLLHSGSGSLTLDSLLLKGGRKYLSSDEKYADGGCVGSSGSVIMTNSAVWDCKAVNSGSGGARGGGIAADGQVVLLSSSVSFNQAESNTGRADGGGIYAGGGVFAKYSNVWGNAANMTTPETIGVGRGGGIFSAMGATTNRSVILFNSAGSGGGLYTMGGDVQIVSSTIYNNSSDFAYASSGALRFNDATSVTISNSTITANRNEGNNAPGGMMIQNATGPILLVSNIISGNTDKNGDPDDLRMAASPTLTGHHNLIGNPGTTTVPPDTIHQVDTPMGDFEYQGATYGLYPAKGSWAFNLGYFNPENIPQTDQNNSDREVGTGVDIGALESDALFLGRFEDPPTF